MKNTLLIICLLLLPVLFIFSCKKGTEKDIPVVLHTDKSQLNFLPEGGTDSIVITSPGRWKFAATPDLYWLQRSKDSGNAGTTTVYIRAVLNPANISRSKTLTISDPDNPSSVASVLINQANDLQITGFNNYKARGGATVNIYGRGFSSVAAENKVTINGIAATVLTASNTNLSVVVPQKAGSGPIIVSASNYADTSATDFIYEWVGVVTVVAGGTAGYKDGTGTDAQFWHPAGIGFDDNGNLYVADYANYKIRKITVSGVVSTLPGRFPPYSNPTSPNTDYGLPIAVSKLHGGGLAIVEYNANGISIFKEPNTVNLFAGGNASALLNGTGTAASFYGPSDLAVDAADNMYIADKDNLCIRKITPAGVVTTFAGGIWGYEDGNATTAKFNRPTGIDIDAAGNLYVTDYFNNRIRKITPAGIVSTFAGSGSFGSNDGDALTQAEFYHPYQICVAPNGIIYISESDGDNLIRLIQPSGKVETIDGFTDAVTGAPVQFNGIYGLATDASGILYLSDSYNNRICKLTYQ